MSQVKRTQHSQAKFNAMLKEFDRNKDGKLDLTDSDLLKAANTKAVSPGYRDLARELNLTILLSRDNNGVINQRDVKGSQPKGSRGFANKRSQALDNQLKSKLSDMKKAQATDLKDREKPWTSDDLARELVLGHPRLLKRASNKDKAFLLLLLRDAGAGKYAHAGPKDQEAILKILSSIPAAQRATILKACGGAETFEKLMQGENKTKFQQLIKTNGINKKNCSTSGTHKSSSSSDVGATSHDQSSGMDAAMGNLRAASKKVQDLWSKYRTAKPEEKKDLMMQIQMAQQEETQLYQFISSMLKSKHQITMGIIRNLP